MLLKWLGFGELSLWDETVSGTSLTCFQNVKNTNDDKDDNIKMVNISINIIF
jgi:hypothetical protein